MNNYFRMGDGQILFPGLDSMISCDTPIESTVMSRVVEPLKGNYNSALFDGHGDRVYPDGLLPETIAAMETLTDEEITQVTIWRDHRTYEFVHIGFVGPEGKICKWADERRALAIAAMERQVRWEEKNAKI